MISPTLIPLRSLRDRGRVALSFVEEFNVWDPRSTEHDQGLDRDLVPVTVSDRSLSEDSNAHFDMVLYRRRWSVDGFVKDLFT